MKIPRLNKKQANKILGDVPHDKVFWLNDGRSLKNLNELSKALNKMDMGLYKYHVNKDKNDFMNWIRHVIGDNLLAKNIAKNKNNNVMYNAVKKRISQLKKYKK